MDFLPLFVIVFIDGLHANMFVTNGREVLKFNENTKKVSILANRTSGLFTNLSQNSSNSNGSSINSSLIKSYENSASLIGLTVDITLDIMFWSIVNGDKSTLYRSTLNGSNQKKIISDCEKVESLSIDWVSHHIYWTDSTRRTIEMSHYDGTGRRLVVMDIDRPCGLVVDPIFGFVFWMDCGRKRLERVNLDGSNRAVMVYSGIDKPRQLAISYATRRIYWIEGGKLLLMSANMHGNGVTIERNMAHSATSIYGLVVIGNRSFVSADRGRILTTHVATRDGTVDTLVAGVGVEDLYTLLSDDLNVQPQSYHQCMEEDNGECSDICLPTVGTGFRCVCPTFGARTVATDSKTCQAPKNILLYTLHDRGMVGLMSVDDSVPHYDTTLVGLSRQPQALTYDPINQIVYWSDTIERRIYRASINGSEKEVFLGAHDGIGLVYGLAYDWLNHRLYFTNYDEITSAEHTNTTYSSHSIELVTVDRTYRKIVVTGVVNPRGLAVDMEKKLVYRVDHIIYLYYTDNTHTPRVVQSWLDGSNPRTLLQDDLTNPASLTLHKGLLYVVDSGGDSRMQTGRVLVCDTVGGTWTPLDTPTQLRRPRGIAFNGDTVYYTEIGSKIQRGRITSFPVDQQREILLEGGAPMDIMFATLDTASIYSGPSHCATSSECTGMCIDTPQQEIKCVCPDGNMEFVSPQNHSSCKVAENFAIFADLNTIKVINLDLHARADDVKTLVRGVSGSNFVALDYHNLSNTVYWSDHTTRSIFSIDLSDPSHINTIYQTDYKVHGLSVEPSGRLFWTGTNSTSQLIARYNPTKGGHSYRVIVSGLDAPRAIVSHEQKRLIFWSEYGVASGIPSLRRSKANGHQVVTLMDKDLYWPNALTVHGNILYVADGFYRRIFSMTFEGSMRKELVFLSGSMDHLYGLSIHAHILFFTDWKSNSTYMVDMVTGRHKTLATHLYRPTDIVVHHPHDLEVRTYCAAHSCDDDCIPIPRGHQCTCQVGRKLHRDGKSCTDAGGLWEVRERFRCDAECSKFAQCARLIPTTKYQCVCSPGYHGNGVVCTSCLPNTYKGDLSNESCTTCPYQMGTRGQKASSSCLCSDVHATHVNGSCIVTPTHTSTSASYHKTVHPATSKHGRRDNKHFILPTHSGVHPGMPKFENCPDGETIIMILPLSANQVLLPITWTARDHEGKELPVKLQTKQYGLRGGYLLLEWKPAPNRDQLIQFMAEDGSGRMVNCQFTVSVRDLEPPTFAYCPHDITTHTTQLVERVLWPRPQAVDNVRMIALSSNHDSGDMFMRGVTHVNYTAVDNSGNVATCNFTVTVLRKIPCELPPVNDGGFVCGQGSTPITSCSFYCADSHVINPLLKLPAQFDCTSKSHIRTVASLVKNQDVCLIECPPGTRHHLPSNHCELCPFGTYQPEGGRTDCLACDNAGNTTSLGAKTSQECTSTPPLDNTTKFIIIASCTAGLVFLVSTFFLYFYCHRRKKQPIASNLTQTTPNLYSTSPVKHVPDADDSRYDTRASLLNKDDNTSCVSTNTDTTDQLNNRPSQYINWREFNGQNTKIYLGYPEKGGDNPQNYMDSTGILSLPFSNNQTQTLYKPNQLNAVKYDADFYANTLSLPFSNNKLPTPNKLTDFDLKPNNQHNQSMTGSMDGLIRPLHKPTIAVSSFNIKHGSNCGPHTQSYDGLHWSPPDTKFSTLQVHKSSDDLDNTEF